MNDTITEINKDTFWGLIREAKDACGQDMSAMVEYLKGRLVSMGAEQAQNFHDITQAYEDLAYKYGLWDAARRTPHQSPAGAGKSRDDPQ